MTNLLSTFKHPYASDTDNVDPSGAVRLDDHCNWVGDEGGKVSGDD